jgi:hypothetical protein
VLCAGECGAHAGHHTLALGEHHVLERERMSGLGEGTGDDALCVSAEHEAEETLGRLIHVASEEQPLTMVRCRGTY